MISVGQPLIPPLPGSSHTGATLPAPAGGMEMCMRPTRPTRRRAWGRLLVVALAAGLLAATTTTPASAAGTGANQFTYTGTWTHCTSACQAGLYNATQSWTNTSGGQATLIFTGTDITLYSLTNNGS